MYFLLAYLYVVIRKRFICLPRFEFSLCILADLVHVFPHGYFSIVDYVPEFLNAIYISKKSTWQSQRYAWLLAYLFHCLSVYLASDGPNPDPNLFLGIIAL